MLSIIDVHRMYIWNKKTTVSIFCIMQKLIDKEERTYHYKRFYHCLQNFNINEFEPNLQQNSRFLYTVFLGNRSNFYFYDTPSSQHSTNNWKQLWQALSISDVIEPCLCYIFEVNLNFRQIPNPVMTRVINLTVKGR